MRTCRPWGLSTPAPITPAFLPQTPNVPGQQSTWKLDTIPRPAEPEGPRVVAEAIEVMQQLEDFDEVKEELPDEMTCVAASSELSLFPLKVVDEGLIAIDSSSGSESSTSSSDDSSPDMEMPLTSSPSVAFSETIPEEFDYYRHRKSSIMSSMQERLTSFCMPRHDGS